jgi:hypothetical protein
MPDFLSTIVENHSQVSPGFVETLIRSQREELFTGLMRLRFPSDEHLVLVFMGGNQHKLYRPSENHTDIIPRQSWPNYLNRADSSVGWLGLSVEALRLLRLAYEVPTQQKDEFSFSWNDLADKTHEWTNDSYPSLIHIRAEDAHKLYLIAGQSIPFIEELTLINGKAIFGMNDASFPVALPERNFEVTRYISDPDHELWQEYRLRHAFSPLMRMLFIRFSELAGRVLTERLCEQLSIWTRDGGLDMTVTSNGISNQHYFETLTSASEAYVGLIRRFHYEASPAIGSRMADGLSRETLMKLDPYSREVLNRHVYDRYGRENAGVKVWR